MSRFLKTFLIPVGVMAVVATAHAEMSHHHSGGSSAYASGSSYAEAWVGGDSDGGTVSSSSFGGSGSPACMPWSVNDRNTVWKVSSSGGCGCKWRVVHATKKWMCPVRFKTARKN